MYITGQMQVIFKLKDIKNSKINNKTPSLFKNKDCSIAKKLMLLGSKK